MKLEKDNIFHIYNQGNNRRRIFFEKAHYNLFISKIKDYIVPYTDVLAWCLMPNHFHILVYTKEEKITLNSVTKERTINSSIGIMLRSYTTTINRKMGWSGSLFREETKAKIIDINQTINTNFYDAAQLQECYNYILLNPVKAGIVNNPANWEFSSFKDTLGIIKPRLINIEKIKEFDLILPNID